jgi:hypothetical protein
MGGLLPTGRLLGEVENGGAVRFLLYVRQAAHGPG